MGKDPAQGVFLGNLFLHPEIDLALSMPAGWTTMNTHAAAGAVSPEQDALVALRLAASGRSVEKLVAEALREPYSRRAP